MATRRARPSKKKGIFGEQARSMELLWGVKSRPSRGPRPGLTLEGIVAAAIAIADAEGLVAVSMQRVAAELGVTTMALYRYVPGKAELVDLMVDIGLASPAAIASVAGDWRVKIAAWARALREVLLQHPWALQATDRLQLMGPNQLGWLESGLAALAGSGLEESELFAAFLAVNAHVRSSAQFSPRAARHQPGVSPQAWSAAVQSLLDSHGERFPFIAAALEAGAFGRSDALDFGLERVLDGIAVHAARRRGAR